MSSKFITGYNTHDVCPQIYYRKGVKRTARQGGSFRNAARHHTDSGGFQVFSLGSAYGKDFSKVISINDPNMLIAERSTEGEIPRLANIGADGVSFRSHIDGSLHYITPEKSIDIQHNLGADILFAFDEATAPGETFQYQEKAMERTHRWAKRSLEHHQKLKGPTLVGPTLFGIVQGGIEQDLRK